MSELLTPTTEDQLRDTILWAAAGKIGLRVRGQGTRDYLGRPVDAGHTLEVTGLSGILRHEPEELLLVARPGTPMSEIQEALDGHNQMLAFEPPLSGTLGGIVAAGLAGPRRVTAGSVRDHLLGFRAVTGRGELFKSGGTVVKNVTGYDLSKLMAGSFGTLAVLSEINLKVLPAPECLRTLLLFGLSDEDAVKAMSVAAGSPYEPSALAHLPVAAAARSNVDYVRGGGSSVTAIRLDGTRQSVMDRLQHARRLFPDTQQEELHTHNTKSLWSEIASQQVLAASEVLWRVSVPPMAGPQIAATLEAQNVLYDWAGGLVWLGEDVDGAWLRDVVNRAGGHATLWRAPDALKMHLPVLHPQPAALDALTHRVKQAFDPLNILNPGKLYPSHMMQRVAEEA